MRILEYNFQTLSDLKRIIDSIPEERRDAMYVNRLDGGALYVFGVETKQLTDGSEVYNAVIS